MSALRDCELSEVLTTLARRPVDDNEVRMILLNLIERFEEFGEATTSGFDALQRLAGAVGRNDEKFDAVAEILKNTAKLLDNHETQIGLLRTGLRNIANEVAELRGRDS